MACSHIVKGTTLQDIHSLPNIHILQNNQLCYCKVSFYMLSVKQKKNVGAVCTMQCAPNYSVLKSQMNCDSTTLIMYNNTVK